ncbi:MAG: ornithine carbamoyltransferase, partial [Thermoanaerobaculia bacterium]
MFQKDLISIHDLTGADVATLFTLAAGMKARPRDFRSALSGKILAMIFEKSSTRTRVSFEAGMTQLGGAAQFLSSRDIQIGRGEPIADTARVLSRYVDGIMARTFAHDTVLELARHATIPIINGLTDLLHPCQALTDYFTMSEKFGKLPGLKLAYVGDGNNMAHSLMYGAPKCGVDVAVATPKGYEPNTGVTANARADAKAAGTTLLVTHSKEEAVRGAHVIYTDVWASMGQEAEQQKRVRDFAG